MSDDIFKSADWAREGLEREAATTDAAVSWLVPVSDASRDLCGAVPTLNLSIDAFADEALTVPAGFQFLLVGEEPPNG